MKRILLIILAMTLFVGCTSEPTIDTSTDEKMKASIEKVRQTLPEDRRVDFNEALQVLAFSNIDFKGLFAQGASGIETTQAKLKKSLHGKTGADVIAASAEVIKQRREKERAQAVQEIQELEKKRAASEKDRMELAKFEIVRSLFYKSKQKYRREQPIIELTVKNGTGHPISRAYFAGTLASPNRAVPWLKDSFNHSIPGGLEHGEKKTWKLSPNMFSEWGTVNAPKDSVLTIEVERLDGPDGKSLFSTREFGEDDVKRLAQLKEQYGKTQTKNGNSAINN